MSHVAVVTCLIDLSRRDPARSRDGQWYVERASTVLGTRHELIAHAEPDLVDVVGEVRARLAPNGATTIVPTTFEDLPTASLTGVIEQAFALGRRPASASNLLKDTADYLALGWAKPRLLIDAASRVGHDTHTLWWVDLALPTSAPEPEAGALDSLLEREVQGVHANVVWETSADEYADRAEFHRTNPFSRVSGGLFGVSTDRVQRFAEIFAEELDACIASGWPTIDEVLLGITVDRLRAEARLSYAPWEAMLTDADGPTTAPWHRLRLMDDCRARGLTDRAVEHARALSAARLAGRIELTVDELARVEAIESSAGSTQHA